MKTFYPIAALVVFTASAGAKMIPGSPRIIQSDVYLKYDTSNNGKLEADEIAAIRADFAKSPSALLKTYDSNHDGMLSDDEIAAIPSTKTEDQPAPAAVKKKQKKK